MEQYSNQLNISSGKARIVSKESLKGATGGEMKSNTSMPSLATGFLGLMAGVVSAMINNPIFAIVAGVLALAAGISSLRISKQFEEQQSFQQILEVELEEVKDHVHKAEEEIQQLQNETASDTSPSESSDILIDTNTGLFSENFFNVALESRIAAARRHLRPISVIFVEVVKDINEGSQPAKQTLVSLAIKKTIREADTACLLKSGYYALVLEDTPETGAVWTVERIRRAIDETDNSLTIWAGIACYPAHAFSREDIVTSAEKALISAKDWKQDRTEVAAKAE